jgi:isocitrate dehydrogenase
MASANETARITIARGDGTALPQIIDLLGALHEAGCDVVKTGNLSTFDGQPGYSLGQGE